MAKDSDGNTALMYACLIGNPDTFNYLVESGGDINVKIT